MADVFAGHLALLAALEQRPRAAARLAGHAERAFAGLGAVVEAGESISLERAKALAREALGGTDFERLHAEGAALVEADIGAIALATDDTA